MMHRIFVPVGQGAFYLEKFEIGEEKFNIVYDCGTSTETVNIKSKIRSYFKKNEEIDYVFISHLHKDHIRIFYIFINITHAFRIYLIFPKDFPKEFSAFKELFITDLCVIILL